MLKKRIIGIVLVKDGWAVQSFGFKKFLPLGKPEVLVENLDRWGADEIVLLSIDRSKNNLGPDFELVKKIGKLNLSTPLSVGGGIKSSDHATKLTELGADRLVINNLFFEDIESIKSISYKIGYQSIIISLPIIKVKNEYRIINYLTKKILEISIKENLKISNIFSEIILMDYNNEGFDNSFDFESISFFKDINKPIIAFGGISTKEQIKKLLRIKKIVAVSIGNFLSYKENSISEIKLASKSKYLRKPYE